MKRVIITTLAISFSVLSILAEAQVYKWTDIKGQIHYSATPPKPNEKILGLKKDLTFSSKATTTNPNNVDTKADEQKETKDELHELKKTSKQKLAFCKRERTNLALLKENKKVTWIENGKETPLSGEMLKNKIQIVEKNIQTNCTSIMSKQTKDSGLNK